MRADLPVLAELGPIGAWHCLHGPIYRYDPRRERGDPTLLVEPPESVIWTAHPEADIERVELDLRLGQAVVWTERTAYVLEPSQLQATWSETGLACASHLRGWIIVAEHALG